MFFRILAGLLTLILLAGGCTPGAISTTAPTAQGDTLPADVEKLVGPTYASPQLQALVNRIGQRCEELLRQTCDEKGGREGRDDPGTCCAARARPSLCADVALGECG